jgi:hypothetical protein
MAKISVAWIRWQQMTRNLCQNLSDSRTKPLRRLRDEAGAET